MPWTLRRVLVASVTLLLGAASCRIVRTPEGVMGGVELPPDLSLVVREGMHPSELISRFGAPARHTRRAGMATMVYTETQQPFRYRLELMGYRVDPRHQVRTELHLVFRDDALIEAWVEVEGKDGESGTKWLVGAPGAEFGTSPPKPRSTTIGRSPTAAVRRLG